MNMMIDDWRTQTFQRIDQTRGIIVDKDAYKQLTHDQVIMHDAYEWIDCLVTDIKEEDFFRTFDWNTGKIEGSQSCIFYVIGAPEYLDSHDCYLIDCFEVPL
jgi:hypothetical protein